MPTLISTFNNGKTDFFALLAKRMGQKGDFPTFSESVQHLDELIHSENRNIAQITSVILSDFALTQKIIRLANSAMYSGMGREITTITQAAVVIGMDAISHIALSIRFIDTLSASVPNSEEAHVELAKAILAGDITRNIVTKSNLVNGEEAVVCALMHHLGRLMLVFYFPEKWSEIQKIAGGKYDGENDATLEIIGIAIDEISQEIAKNWRLPHKISNSMVDALTFNETNIPGSLDWLRVMANFAGRAASMLVRKNDEDLKNLIRHYSELLVISREDMLQSINLARNTVKGFAIESKTERYSGKPNDSRERLAVSAHELNIALTREIDFNNVLSMVLESIYASMRFNRVVIFFRDAGAFKARLSFGNLAAGVLQKLIFPEAYAADVFHLSLANKADVFIQEVTSGTAASSIPTWFREALPDVDTFILLPLVFNNRAIGLIYADWRIGATSLVEPSELSSMGMLRDYLIKALVKRK